MRRTGVAVKDRHFATVLDFAGGSITRIVSCKGMSDLVAACQLDRGAIRHGSFARGRGMHTPRTDPNQRNRRALRDIAKRPDGVSALLRARHRKCCPRHRPIRLVDSRGPQADSTTRQHWAGAVPPACPHLRHPGRHKQPARSNPGRSAPSQCRTLALNHHACASGLLALDHAAGLLAADPDPGALALVGDKLDEVGMHMLPGITFLREAAAACLMRQGRDGDRLLARATRILDGEAELFTRSPARQGMDRRVPGRAAGGGRQFRGTRRSR